MREVKIHNGMEVVTTIMGRHEPSMSMTIKPTSRPAISHLMRHLVDGFPHEDRCIGDDFNVHMGRHDLLDARKGCPDAVDHVQGRRLAAFHDDNNDGLFTVHDYGVCLRRPCQLNIGDVAQENERISFPFNRNIVEFRNLRRHRVCLDHPVGLLDLHIARGQHDILAIESRMDIGWRYIASQHLVLIEGYQKLLGLSTVRMRNNRPGDHDNQGPELVIRKIVEVCRRHLVRGNLQAGNRYLRGFQPHDHGRRNIRRQRLDNRLGYGCDFRFCAREVGVGLKKNIRDADAVVAWLTMSEIPSTVEVKKRSKKKVIRPDTSVGNMPA